MSVESIQQYLNELPIRLGNGDERYVRKLELRKEFEDLLPVFLEFDDYSTVRVYTVGASSERLVAANYTPPISAFDLVVSSVDQIIYQYKGGDITLEANWQAVGGGGTGSGLPDLIADSVLVTDNVPEAVFEAKSDAFNKPFGTVADTIAEGDHTHELDDLLATGITANLYLKSLGDNTVEFAEAVDSRIPDSTVSGSLLVGDGSGNWTEDTITPLLPATFNVYLNSTFT